MATFLKYLILLLSAPVWLPFLRALWDELENALRDQGGLFGQEPSAEQLIEIRREQALEEDRVLNEPLAHRRASTPPQSGR
ncbi:MAG: hypothetical protein ACI8QZ_001514 [Chlamydiales bacterium]|jgi:hypothetical protein